MTREELLQDLLPILNANTDSSDAVNIEAGDGAEEIIVTRQRVLPDCDPYYATSFPGYFIEAVAAYCKANFVSWIMAYDRDRDALCMKIN